MWKYGYNVNIFLFNVIIFLNIISDILNELNKNDGLL